MKKAKLLSLCLVISAFGLASLGSGSSNDSDKKEIVSSDTSAENSSEVEKTNSDDKSEKIEETKETDSKTTPTIEEQFLFEMDGLTVTATEYVVDSIWGDGIKILIENNGDTDMGLSLDAGIVNDYMISELFSSTVAAGKKSYETINFSSSDLKAAGINNIGKIEFYMHTFNPDNYMTISHTDCLTIETSLYEVMDQPTNDDGQELFNSDGIRIIGKYVDEDTFWGNAVLLYLENNSGKNVIVQVSDMSINGFMVSPIFSCTLYDQKKAVDDITIFKSDLEENGISSIDEIELKFKIIDENYINHIETDAITFKTK